MILGNFNDLETVKFQSKLNTRVVEIYNTLFDIKGIRDLRAKDSDQPHVLDQEFAIDKLIVLKSGHWISIQEKFRKNIFLTDPKYQVESGTPDFTQEYKNGNNTLGEWFKLAAQIYFYGWANKEETDFEKFVIVDILKYKLLIEKLGGIEKCATKRKNFTHGGASFYCFPITMIKDAWIFTHKDIKTT